jgi:peptide chain release factor 1
MSLEGKLASIKHRHEELTALMSQGGLSGDAFAKLSMEYAELTPVVEAIDIVAKAKAEKAGLEEMLNDPEMKDIAAEELRTLEATLPKLEHQIKMALIPKDEDDARNAILEIRAGTGGDEAGLFVGDLLGMYRGYAASQNWKFEIVEASENDVGGYKTIIAEVTGRNVFSKLKYESGTHRVQRVPKTETQGRIHTSAATVAILAEVEETAIEILDKDLKVDTYRSQGSGGQHVNTTDSAIRITHIPTGVVVECQAERSQHKNRARAMKMLATHIYDMQRNKLAAERAQERKSQVGSGDRSERIRTYNFPQGRCTDHRINLTLYKLDEVMRGPALEEILEGLIAEDSAAALATLES